MFYLLKSIHLMVTEADLLITYQPRPEGGHLNISQTAIFTLQKPRVRKHAKQILGDKEILCRTREVP